jgi:rare lipoprotein A
MRISHIVVSLFIGILSVAPMGAEAGQKGRATWYGPEYAGKITASGEMFDPWAMTAAHPTLPLGCVVEVRRLTKDRKDAEPRSVLVRINDRFDAAPGRIDLSEAAARVLRFRNKGGGPVEITVIPQLAEAR